MTRATPVSGDCVYISLIFLLPYNSVQVGADWWSKTFLNYLLFLLALMSCSAIDLFWNFPRVSVLEMFVAIAFQICVHSLFVPTRQPAMWSNISTRAGWTILFHLPSTSSTSGAVWKHEHPATRPHLPLCTAGQGRQSLSHISIKYSSRTEMNRSLCINMQLMIIFLLCLISAGVGRTGTYIALDLMIEHARHESKVSFFKTVKRLRDDRCSMVQNKVGTTPLYCH